MSEQRMPVLFIGHGSPMNAIESNPYTESWRRLGERLPRPRAILAISAHWYTDGTHVTAMARPQTLHDFRGFPPSLYECEYPAPGAPQLARRIRQLLEPMNIGLSNDWGLDHGSWSVLMQMYPRAEIPTLQLSIDAGKPAEFHYQLGQQLRALRDEGVLILASGNVVHNLGLLRREANAEPYDWASAFNDRVRNALIDGDHGFLIHCEQAGAEARLSIPTAEHFLPLLYILGASDGGDKLEFPCDGIALGAISMLSVLYAR
ncbi:4,5-DOPA dioxygenase extradiol [Microbulbifer taiwanensis]|uniref:4,5-DOPA dioxygenase extradiol n=1 Tax=Microbulbifer taiwanensis TaxID=986746 RepID=A0ABW1YSJ2_9GAMM|nr:4,5-DOPA dioxygenase extradiol [Microbulbifer taiwanensis]